MQEAAEAASPAGCSRCSAATRRGARARRRTRALALANDNAPDPDRASPARRGARAATRGGARRPTACGRSRLAVARRLPLARDGAGGGAVPRGARRGRVRPARRRRCSPASTASPFGATADPIRDQLAAALDQPGALARDAAPPARRSASAGSCDVGPGQGAGAASFRRDLRRRRGDVLATRRPPVPERRRRYPEPQRREPRAERPRGRDRRRSRPRCPTAVVDNDADRRAARRRRATGSSQRTGDPRAPARRPERDGLADSPPRPRARALAARRSRAARRRPGPGRDDEPRRS